MSNIRIAYLAAAALAAAAGCAHKPTVVGTWNGSTTMPQGKTVKSTLTFTGDGKETLQAQAPSPLGDFTFQAGGTYTATDTTLTQNLTSFTMSMNGKTLPAGAGMTKTETDQMKLDGDTLTLTSPNGKSPQVFTRAK